ncbi:alpha/beta fold hydrolase [Nocardioides kongjuensis]|uniref:3-oxoadipate enol-lactonase n=1 Tax=Nocardioides kongjuensis TaxID=349522 RepID=A0A852RQJ0_9ACTN|nr:3-oxoadipate enol-lactonase [Nocardioides kongjuensis]
MSEARFAASDGTTIAHRTFGNGPRVVTALHTLSLDGSWYARLAEALGSSYRVVCPDFRGHGGSDEGPEPMTLARLAADVVDLWEHLGIDTSVVLGVSMGGMVAQAVAASAPDRVEALVLTATGGGFAEDAREGALQRLAGVRSAPDMGALVPVTLERWFGDAAAADDLDRARDALARTSTRIHADALEAMLDVGRFGPPEPAVPTLVVGGDADVSAPPAAIDALAAKYPGSRRVSVPGPHLFALTDPAVFAAEVRAFLDEHPIADRETPR